VLAGAGVRLDPVPPGDRPGGVVAAVLDTTGSGAVMAGRGN